MITTVDVTISYRTEEAETTALNDVNIEIGKGNGLIK